ncbi:DUF2218 domain-containing protein [Rhizobium redzepovicii]|uniref:DUF2218 domain-containing protein n=1 Tax=Rhizobium redzepovicii TaxID=2867518 RepID=A0AAW8P961_9HYPH|nr:MULTISPECIES: DUF2218 domain-containing protein [Rhizobium]MBB3527321.1 hypothetical protein [Rhizobium sp. BK456]MBY4592770.1 DUF2218 domain-containing protein [Rhizobium redzepovicii]MBY4614158.1 DUF2218 domain-containing protein [Rhizobium redzepovicii]MDF0660322.1 DUF2218 domain-containing protein [Rhizobium sp. BC49]MDR9763548.1 DUF2218 domain-containing protein [Rhizobium redzepovicii]
MHLSQAVVRTEHASRYLQQLCKHWSHKFSVDFDPNKGRVPFSETAEVTFTADDAALTMILSVADPEQQLRMQGVIDDHLKRFAFREELDIVWTD